MIFIEPELELITEPSAQLTGAGSFQITEFGCKLLSLRIGKLELSRDQCASVTSDDHIKRVEQLTFGTYRDEHQSAFWHVQADREHELAEWAT